MKKILAIGAHPDDLEVGCYGTLLKHKKQGDEVHMALTTKGGYGNRDWETILKEFEKSLDILKPDSSIILDNKIGHLEINWKTVTEIDKLIDEYSIDTIYSHWYGDGHQDHQTTYKIVMAACRQSRVSNVYCCELGNYVFHAHYAFRPQLFIGIDNEINEKIQAMKCYSTYFKDEDVENIKSLNHYRGSCCRSEYAEAFEIIRETR